MPRLLTTSEVAEMLNLTRNSVARMVKQGSLPPPIRLSTKTFRFREDELLAHLEQRKGVLAAERA